MKLGIDLGTYNSSAAYVLVGNEPVQVASRSGANAYGKQFPSFVKFDAHGNVEFTGEPARNALANNPLSVVWGTKRLVGRTYSSAQREIKRFAYRIERGPNDTIVIPQGDKAYTPEQILQIILEQIKKDASDSQVNPILAGETIDEAVITAPAYFDAFRYNSYIRDAATKLGFKRVNIIPEPVAAARRYGLQVSGSMRILAFDLGAGTLDVTVLRVSAQGDRWFAEETITSGNPEFGGIDMDDLLFEFVARGITINNQPTIRASIRDKIEQAKIELTEFTDASVPIPGGRTIRLNRGDLKRIITPSLEEKCSGPIHVALTPDGKPIGPLIDHVLLIGGPTKMHCVREYLVPKLRSEGVREDVLAKISLDPNAPNEVNPMNCVSEGAAANLGNMGVRDSYGYGTTLGGQYCEIIPVNSALPIEGEVVISARGGSRVITIPLYSRVPNTKVQQATTQEHQWTYLGDFSLAIVPESTDTFVRFRMELDEFKIATVNLQRLFPAGDRRVLAEKSPTTGREGERREYYSLSHVKRIDIPEIKDSESDPIDIDGSSGDPPPPRPVPPPIAPLSDKQIKAIVYAVRQHINNYVRPQMTNPTNPQSQQNHHKIASQLDLVESLLEETGRTNDQGTATDLVNKSVELLWLCLDSADADQARRTLESLLRVIP